MILTDFSREGGRVGPGLLGTAGLPAEPLILLLPCPLTGFHQTLQLARLHQKKKEEEMAIKSSKHEPIPS